jgi:hypothetical protein
MSSRPRGNAIVPMNGMAGAGLTAGIFGVLLAVLVGFAAVPFAVVAVIVGVVAVFCSLRGRALARTVAGGERIAGAGLIFGALAILLGVLGVLLR